MLVFANDESKTESTLRADKETENICNCDDNNKNHNGLFSSFSATSGMGCCLVFCLLHLRRSIIHQSSLAAALSLGHIAWILLDFLVGNDFCTKQLFPNRFCCTFFLRNPFDFVTFNNVMVNLYFISSPIRVECSLTFAAFQWGFLKVFFQPSSLCRDRWLF